MTFRPFDWLTPRSPRPDTTDRFRRFQAHFWTPRQGLAVIFAAEPQRHVSTSKRARRVPAGTDPFWDRNYASALTIHQKPMSAAFSRFHAASSPGRPKRSQSG